jgi:ABC-type multidrug transport system permease subunit
MINVELKILLVMFIVYNFIYLMAYLFIKNKFISILYMFVLVTNISSIVLYILTLF